MEKKIYMVGGCVRDHLLGKTPRDIDFVAVGYSEQDCLDQGWKKVGKAFPVFITEDGYEVALARKEKSTGDGYKDFSFETNGVTLEEDLNRRDLSINSIAMDDEGNIVDPYYNIFDLEFKIIRMNSKEAFMEDPLRVFRVARFKAKLPEFDISIETDNCCTDIIREDKHTSLSSERIWMETLKAMDEEEPGLYFKTLFEFGFTFDKLITEDYLEEIIPIINTAKSYGVDKEWLISLFYSYDIPGYKFNDLILTYNLSNSIKKKYLLLYKYWSLFTYFDKSRYISFFKEKISDKDFNDLLICIELLNDSNIDKNLIKKKFKEFKQINARNFISVYENCNKYPTVEQIKEYLDEEYNSFLEDFKEK